MEKNRWKAAFVVFVVLFAVAGRAAEKPAITSLTNTKASGGIGNCSVGWDFSPTADIRVTHVGLWLPEGYHGGAGFYQSHDIRIWEIDESGTQTRAEITENAVPID